jgi:hypothetical protein
MKYRFEMVKQTKLCHVLMTGEFESGEIMPEFVAYEQWDTISLKQKMKVRQFFKDMGMPVNFVTLKFEVQLCGAV